MRLRDLFTRRRYGMPAPAPPRPRPPVDWLPERAAGETSQDRGVRREPRSLAAPPPPEPEPRVVEVVGRRSWRGRVALLADGEPAGRARTVRDGVGAVRFLRGDVTVVTGKGKR